MKYVGTIHKHVDMLQYGTCTGIECIRIEYTGISTPPSVFDSDAELCKQKEAIVEQGKLVKKWKIICIQGHFFWNYQKDCCSGLFLSKILLFFLNMAEQ